MWSLYFIWAGPRLLYYLVLSTRDELQRLSLGPIYLLPQGHLLKAQIQVDNTSYSQLN